MSALATRTVRIADLVADVAIASPANGQALVYDSASGKWKNAAAPAPASGNLDSLTDVTITSPSDGQRLIYDGASGQWKNVAALDLTGYVLQAGRSGGQHVAGGVAGGEQLLLLGTAATTDSGTIKSQATTHQWFTAADVATQTERMRLTSTGRLGIGVTSPNAMIDIVGTDFFGGISDTVYNNTPSTGAFYSLVRRRGTPASPLDVVSGDTVGQLRCYAYANVSGGSVGTGAINNLISGAPAAGGIPGDFQFTLGTATGATERMRLFSAGNLLQYGAAAIPTASMGNSTFGMWQDPTPAAPKLMVTAKDSAGTLRTALVSNIPPLGVGLTMPTDFTVGGSPAVDGGTIAVTRASQASRLFLASPSGASGVPSYRAIAAVDIPALTQYELLSNKGAASGYAPLDATGKVPVANLPTYPLGTVTSVGIAAPADISVSGSPVTGAGTITLARLAQAMNTVLAGPTSGANAVPVYRALVAQDIPALSQYELTANKGANSGYAALDSSGVVPIGQIPILPNTHVSGLGTASTHADTDYVTQLGRAGGQQVAGGVATGENLTLLGSNVTNFGIITHQANTHIWQSDATTERMRLSSAGYLGIGTNNPGWPLHIVSPGGIGTITDAYGTPPQSSIYYRGARGSVGSPAAVVANDIIAQYVWAGHDGTAFRTGMNMSAYVYGAPTASGCPMLLVFQLNDGTSTKPALRLIPTQNAILYGNAAPPTAQVANGAFCLWLDATPASTKLMVTGKDSAGTLKSATVATLA